VNLKFLVPYTNSELASTKFPTKLSLIKIGKTRRNLILNPFSVPHSQNFILNYYLEKNPYAKFVLNS
jgi:hypothetical protein